MADAVIESDGAVTPSGKPRVAKGMPDAGGRAAPVGTPAPKAPAEPPPRAPVANPRITSQPDHSRKDASMDSPTLDPTPAKTGLADMQDAAKAAYEKSASSLGDVNEFARGNVEAMIQSGKILAAGLQDMGSALATESRSMFEALSADVKELAAVRSPGDYLRLQSEMMRKMFDRAIAYNMKQAEVMRKLASDSAAPLSQRIKLATDKISTTP